MRFLCRIGIHSWIHEEDRVFKNSDTGRLLAKNFWRCKHCKKLIAKWNSMVTINQIISGSVTQYTVN